MDNGKHWELYKIIDQDNLDYTTFSTAFKDKIGQEVEIEYTEEQSGKYINRRIVERKKSNAEIINDKLDLIIEKLNLLIKKTGVAGSE